MKFISFITSTMLIVLISQHSMGLPLTSTIVGETCSEGFEMFNGKCMPIQSSTIGVETETVTNLTEIITRNVPEEDHVNVTEANSPKISKHCPPGSKYLEGGECGPVEPLVITKLNDESTTSSILPETATEFEPMVHPKEVSTTTELEPIVPLKEVSTTTELEPIVHPKEVSTTTELEPIVHPKEVSTTTELEPIVHPKEVSTTTEFEPMVPLKEVPTTTEFEPKVSPKEVLTITKSEPLVHLEEESTTKVYKPHIYKRCPPGSKYLKNGKCGPVERPVVKELNDEPTTSILPETATEFEPTAPLEEDSTTEVYKPQISKRCPPGSRYLKSGKCGPVERPVIKELNDETTATVELTTDLNDDEHTGGVDNPQGCPKGTEADEQGACQEIQGANSEKMTTEPSFPVNQACPQGYKKFNGKCVYVEKQPSPGDLQPKSGDIETSTDEVIPQSDDGTCPDETAYIGSGFCKKLNRPTPANVPINSDGRCRANYELVDDICVYKDKKIVSELGVPMSTIAMPLHPTVDEGEIGVNTDNLFQPTTSVTDY